MSIKLSKQDLNKIKRDLQLKICAEAEKNGYFKIAQIIRNAIEKLNKKNIEWAISNDVEVLSSTVKERAKLFLFIQTKFPDWFKIDRKILLDKVDEIKIFASFSEAKYPFDENINEFVRLGIKSGLVPGLPSINISNKEVTFFYIADPFSNDFESRLGITIKGKIGMNLARQLMPLYLEALNKSIDMEVLTSIENKMRNALRNILLNKEEKEIIHDLIYETDLDIRERICLSIFLIQLGRNNNEFVTLKEIEKDIDLEEKEIQRELERIIYQFEYLPRIAGKDAKIRLKSISLHKWMPRLLFSIINTKSLMQPKINRIRIKYQLLLPEGIYEKDLGWRTF